MFEWTDQFGPFGRWLIEASWQAAVLAMMVMLAQVLCGRWLSARWRYALWGVVIVRPALGEPRGTPRRSGGRRRLGGRWCRSSMWERDGADPGSIRGRQSEP